MSRTVSRTTAWKSTYVVVVISPRTMTRPVVVAVSQATRASGSSRMIASRMASEIWSHILSGWPSVTDSEVNRYWSASTMLICAPDSSHVDWIGGAYHPVRPDPCVGAGSASDPGRRPEEVQAHGRVAGGVAAVDAAIRAAREDKRLPARPSAEDREHQRVLGRLKVARRHDGIPAQHHELAVPPLDDDVVVGLRVPVQAQQLAPRLGGRGERRSSSTCG